MKSLNMFGYFFTKAVAFEFTVFNIVIASQSCYNQVNPDCQAYQCSVPIHQRIDCSPGEVSRDSCLARGGCFDNSRFGTTWCFEPLRLREGKCPHAECQVIPEKREACPLFNNGRIITPKICEAAGCCYDDDTYGAPVCFKRKVYAVAFPLWLLRRCAMIDPSKRQSCCKDNCDLDQCMRWRCCWLPVALEGPQCYHY